MKLQNRNLGFKTISFIAISTDLKTHTKSLTMGAPAKDVVTIRTKAHELVKSFLSERPMPLRRVGIRISNLVEEKGQKTLGDY